MAEHSVLPTYIPLLQAAAQYPLSPTVLQSHVEAGTIKAVQTPEGTVLVNSEDVRRVSLPVDPALKGKPIRITEAAEKYGVNHQSLARWANAGYVRILEQGPKLLVLDEGEVQRAAAIYQYACHQTGSSVRAGWILKRTLA